MNLTDTFSPRKAKETRLKSFHLIGDVFNETQVPRLKIFDYENGIVDPIKEHSLEAERYLDWLSTKYNLKAQEDPYPVDMERGRNIFKEYEGKFAPQKAKRVRLANNVSIEDLFTITGVPRLSIFSYEEGSIDPVKENSTSSYKYLHWITGHGYAPGKDILSQDGWSWLNPPYKHVGMNESVLSEFNSERAQAVRALSGITLKELSKIVDKGVSILGSYEKGTRFLYDGEKYLLWLKDNGYDGITQQMLDFLREEHQLPIKNFDGEKVRTVRSKLNFNEVAKMFNLSSNQLRQLELGKFSSGLGLRLNRYLFWLKDNGYDEVTSEDVDSCRARFLEEGENWVTLDPAFGVKTGSFLFYRPMSEVIETMQKIFPRELIEEGLSDEKARDVRKKYLETKSLHIPANELERIDQGLEEEASKFINWHGYGIVTPEERSRILYFLLLKRNKYTKNCPLPREFHGQDHIDAVLSNTVRNHPDRELIETN